MLMGTHPNIQVMPPVDPHIRAEVSVCLVSREPIDPQILKSLEGFGEVIVGDGTHGVIARYEAIAQAKYGVIYTQDDDCVVDVPALMSEWDGHFVSNMKANRAAEYPGNLTLIGWGAMFKKELINVLADYVARYGDDALYRRECDRVFTGLNTHKNVFVDCENLPNAFHGRLSNDPQHWDYLAEVKKRVAAMGGS